MWLGEALLRVNGDERVTLWLESERKVELQLGLLTPDLIGTVGSGARLTTVGIRRRRRGSAAEQACAPIGPYGAGQRGFLAAFAQPFRCG